MARDYRVVIGGINITLDLVSDRYNSLTTSEQETEYLNNGSAVAEVMANLPHATLEHAFREFTRRYPRDARLLAGLIFATDNARGRL